MEFGQHLKAARLQKNLSQEQVAEEFFVSRQTVSNWENEKSYPDIASLIKLSNYYQISLDTLLKEDTGMREYLEKKEVSQGLKPIRRNLTIVNLLLLLFFICSNLGLIHNLNYSEIKAVLILTVLLAFILNSASIISLNNFDYSYSLKKVSKRELNLLQHTPKFLISKAGLIGTIVICLICIILAVLSSSKIISIILVCIGGTCLGFQLALFFTFQKLKQQKAVKSKNKSNN